MHALVEYRGALWANKDAMGTGKCVAVWGVGLE
jgi:hypothetical protein